jgi:hypothetical protein
MAGYFRQTRSNSVLSGGVGLHGSYSRIKLLRSELVVLENVIEGEERKESATSVSKF